MKERWLPEGMKGTATAYELLIDRHMYALTGSAWKTLLYVCRRTIGFGKQYDRISLSQICDGITTRDGRRLDYGTGLTRKSAWRAVRELENCGLVIRTAPKKPLQALFEIYWERIAQESRNCTGVQNTPAPGEKVRGSLGEKVHPQLSVVQQSDQRSEIHDIDCPTKNRKRRDSSSGVSFTPVLKQYPKLREALARYMREGNDEKVYPSDRHVVDVMDAADGATEDEVIRILVYFYNERGLRPGTDTGPRSFAWFPSVIADYVEKKAIREAGRTPIGYDDWQERNETRKANLAALELPDADEPQVSIGGNGEHLFADRALLRAMGKARREEGPAAVLVQRVGRCGAQGPRRHLQTGRIPRNLLKNPVRQRQLHARIAKAGPIEAFQGPDLVLGGGAAC